MRTAAWLGLFLLAASLLLAPLSFEARSRLPDDADSLGVLYILWWTATHLDRGYPGVLDAPIYYPHPKGLVYSEPMLGQALLAAPLFALVDEPVLVYNVVAVLSLGLGGFAAFLLFRELTGSAPGALVGATVYALNGYAFSHLPRLQLVSLQWMPLALLALHRWMRTGRWPALAATVVFSVLHGISCFYYLVFYGVALAVLVPTDLVAVPSARRPRILLPLAAAFAAVGAALLYVAWPYVSFYERYEIAAEPGSFDLAGYLLPPQKSLLYGWLDPPFQLVDHFLGYGAILLGVLGLGAVLRHRVACAAARRVAFGYATLGGIAFFLSSGTELRLGPLDLGPGPFRLLRDLGPFGKLHDPDRLAILVYLALGVFVAWGVARIVAPLARRRAIAVAGTLALVVLAEQWSPARGEGVAVPVGADIPAVYEWLAARPGAEPVAEMPVLPFRAIRRNMVDAYFATRHGKPILFAKPSFAPPAHELLRWELRTFPDERATTLLGALGVDLAVVHPRRWPEEQRGHFLAQLERAVRDNRLVPLETFADREDPLWRRYGLGGERAYRIVPLGEEGAPRPCRCREIDRASFGLDANGVNDPSLAVDGDRRTKWTTGAYQQKGFYFEIAFDRRRRPVRIEIEMAYPYEEFPRNLEVNGFRGPRFWRLRKREDVWYTVALVRQLVADPTRARLRYDFEPMEVDRIRLFIHRTEEGTHGWSIPEIHVYEEIDEGPGADPGESEP